MKRWYIVQTFSGYEKSVIDDLNTRKVTMNLEDKIFRVISPEEEYEEIKIDKRTNKEIKKVKKRRVYPGYVFVEIEIDKEIDDETWYIVRNTPRVTGLLGSSGKGKKPNYMSDRDIATVLKHEGIIVPVELPYSIGDTVEIISGVFKDHTGVVANINLDKRQVTVMIEFFGRQTPNELGLHEVKKI